MLQVYVPYSCFFSSFFPFYSFLFRDNTQLPHRGGAGLGPALAHLAPSRALSCIFKLLLLLPPLPLQTHTLCHVRLWGCTFPLALPAGWLAGASLDAQLLDSLALSMPYFHILIWTLHSFPFATQCSSCFMNSTPLPSPPLLMKWLYSLLPSPSRSQLAKCMC